MKQHTLNTNNVEITLTDVNTKTGLLQIVVMYRSKVVPMKEFSEALEIMCSKINHSLPTLITGDFNVDFLQETLDKQKIMTHFDTSLKCRPLINEATTDYNSCLDNIYTNIPESNVVSCGVQESFYSDHKSVWITLA